MGGQGFELAFQRQLATQSWTLYAIGMFVILLRTFARWRRVGGFSLLAPDDWLMMVVVPTFFTTLIVCLNVIATGGGSNLYPPEQYVTFTQEDIEERIKGSKIVVVSEQAMLNVIWTLKACMLFMYTRMTLKTNHIRWIKCVAIYVAIGWIAVEVAFFTACRPFNGYWGMPPPNPQCTTLEHYAIVQAVFNLSSDCLMIAIPLPMIVSLSLPLKQKIVLGIVFSMGIFVVIAAILTKVYNLSDVYDTAYMLWYTREASVAVYVANLPSIWPLLREHVRFLRSHTSYPSTPHYAQYGSHARPQSQYGNLSRTHRSRKQTTQKNDEGYEIELGCASFSESTSRAAYSNEKIIGREERVGHFGRKLGDLAHTRRGSPESDERALNDTSTTGWGKMNLEVHVDRTIEVQRGDWDGSGKAGFEGKVKIEGPKGEVVSK